MQSLDTIHSILNYFFQKNIFKIKMHVQLEEYISGSLYIVWNKKKKIYELKVREGTKYKQSVVMQ